MKKIGLLTFQNTTNYGSMLQAYALYYSIKAVEPSCELINYHCHAIEDRELPIRLKNCRSIKRFIKWLLCYQFSNIKYKHFQKFLDQQFECTDKFYNSCNISEIANSYQKFIVGSDIIWGLDITGGDYTYFLDFANDKQKFSYAASFGHDNLPFSKEEIKKMQFYIQKFDGISVRESSGVNIVNDLTHRTAQLVLDPTLLLDKDDWKTALHLKKMDWGRYILVYFAYDETETFRLVKILAQKEKCRIIYIHNSTLNYPGVKNVKTASIERFLELLYNATYIVTGSYHGVVFSINFNKQFFYINKKYTARIKSLVSLFEIRNHILIDDNIETIVPIKYEPINCKLLTLREQSLSVLYHYINYEY